MERLPRKRFQVCLARTETRHAVAVVEAADEKHARVKAFDQAGDVDFSCGTAGQPEYSVEGVDEFDQGLPASLLSEFAQQLLRNARPELQDGLTRLAPQQVIASLGPYAVKDASQIHQTGYDVISDHSFINVLSLHEAEQLCRALNAIYEQDKENLDSGRENPCARQHEDADPHASR